MNLMLVLAVNSITLGGLLFLLSSGFSLIFGLMRIPNLTHGSLFMLGAYIGASLVVWYKLDFWLAAIVSALLVAAFGGLIERLLLRRLAGNSLAQVLVTLGIAFMIADACLMALTGDPIHGSDSARTGRRRSRLWPHIPDLPPGRDPDRGCDRGRALASA